MRCCQGPRGHYKRNAAFPLATACPLAEENLMAEFFTHHIVAVYFFYGLSFFSMGLAILLEAGRVSRLDFAQALRPLAGFGLVHGSHEWIEMFLLIRQQSTSSTVPSFVGPLRLFLLVASFLMLLAFGARLVSGGARPRLKWVIAGSVGLVWGVGLVIILLWRQNSADVLTLLDAYTRYSLAIPGGILACWGLIKQRQKFYQEGMKSLGRDAALAAVAFGVYGGIGQLFPPASHLFPWNYLNTEVFLHWAGFPIQVLRAAMACMAAVFMIRSLRAFEEETRNQIEGLREAQLAEGHRLEALRGELLHRTVKAQESERQRIARELHDELGQTLTALGMGLRGMSDTARNNPERACQQALQLQILVDSGLTQLKNLVTGLHPPQLDDLGLLAALRWYASEMSERCGVQITVNSHGTPPDLPEEMRAVLYRIAQEAITNVVRHSGAQQAELRLVSQPHEIQLVIRDGGKGFDVEAALNKKKDPYCWGLLGMIERAELVNGICQITSRPGQGTSVEVKIPVELMGEDHHG